jgi:Flp pilus assembly protein TadD
MSILLLLAVATASPMAEAPAAQPALDYGRLIDDAIDGGRIIQAETMLAQWRVNAQAQESAAVDIAVARMALAKGENAQAETRFAAMHQTGSKDCRVDEGLGIARLRRGRTEQAADALRRAVDRCAGRWRAWNALGVAHDAEKAWALSAAAYEKAFQLTDKPVQVLNNYGLSLMAQGQAEKAVAIFARAQEMMPDDPRIIANGDAAQVMAGRDIERRPADDANGWAKRLGDAGKVALNIGDTARARAYLSRAVTVSESYQADAAAALAGMGGTP